MLKRAVFLLGIAAAAVPAAASASQWGVGAMHNWKAADHCAADAQRLFPDHTAEANAKRDAQLRACLAAGLLPPRDLSGRPPSASK